MPKVRRWYSKAAAAICLFAGESDPPTAMRTLVDRLLSQAEITQPCPPMKLVASFRRVRDVVPCEMVEAGRLVPKDGAFQIHVNQRHSEEKQRFTCGHEICHTFFKSALASAGDCLGFDTGLFNIQQEEEYLCDIGSGHMLLHPSWLVPMARSLTPSLDGLCLIAGRCGSSIEAAALQLASHGVWNCSFVFWEPGLRESERAVLNSGVQPLFASAGISVLPVEKLRVHRVYSPDGMPFLPPMKSAKTDTQIHRAWMEQTRTEGRDSIDLGSGRIISGYWQSEYMPYSTIDGSVRPRVVSCVLWDRPTRQSSLRVNQSTLSLFGPN